MKGLSNICPLSVILVNAQGVELIRRREKPAVDTLPVNSSSAYPDGHRFGYWLRLASIALGDENKDDKLIIEEPGNPSTSFLHNPAPQKVA